MFKANQEMNKKLFTNNTSKRNIKRSHLTLCYKQKKKVAFYKRFCSQNSEQQHTSRIHNSLAEHNRGRQTRQEDKIYGITK